MLNTYESILTYRCDPYDPSEFKTWVMTGGCPAIPAMLELFRKLVDSGFKVFMHGNRKR